MSDEIELLREFRAVPDVDDEAIRRIHEQAIHGERAALWRFSGLSFTRPRYAAALVAIAAVVGGVSVPLLLGNNQRGNSAGSSPNHLVAPRMRGAFGPTQAVPASSIAVSDVKAADDLLPFKAVLPSNATPTQVQVGDPKQTPASEAWLSAQFDTSDNGSYQLFERASDYTVTTLEGWARDSASCSGCTVDQVVTEDGVHVFVLASPVLGLQLYWLRGDGSSPVLNQLVWASDTFNQQRALSVAGDIISQSG